MPTASVETTKVESARTTSLAHRTGSRAGTAAPRTTTASWARSAAMLNTKMLLLLASFSVARDATTAENKVTIPTTVASVIASVQTVERTVANLIHSDFTAAK